MSMLDQLSRPMNRQQRRQMERACRKVAAGAAERRAPVSSTSTPAASGPSPSPDERAAKFALIESFDGFAGLRDGLKRVAARDKNWAGIPMPLDDQRLVIEPRFPSAKELMAMGKAAAEEATASAKYEREHPGEKVRQVFYSRHKRCDVVIFERDGKIDWGLIPRAHHFRHDIQTLGASIAWGIEQESNALQLLGTMIRHHQLKQYLLTGMFLETSKRSGLTYMFRKLKPTVVIDTRQRPVYQIGATEVEPNDGLSIVCALCLHPVGYYQGSWAGALCPTDDVIAHLLLMRADEPLYWRQANQHAAWTPEAGL